jgi:hypothetical protein
MELLCYVFPGWQPRIRPAQAQRDWMDQSPESFAYRCLPLNIANAHGWEILNPTGFSVIWNGGPAAEDVTIRLDDDADQTQLPQALFGMGTVTFHVAGLIKTPPGWNLWVGGPPNSAKDGIAPLSGIIESDWSPFSFTMNWRLTRPDHWIRFEENEPFALFFPVQRDAVESFVPRCLPIDDDPALKMRFETWSRSRDDFQKRMMTEPPEAPTDKWQKFYYRGTDASGHRGVADHRAKLRILEFADAPTIPVLAKPPCHSRKTPPSTLARREWLLTTIERQRALSAEASTIYRVEKMGVQQFLDEHYALNRPVILCDLIHDWPACATWTPDYLHNALADRMVTFQSGRAADPCYERNKDAHKRQLPFAQFLDLTLSGNTNDSYLTAYTARDNAQFLQPLSQDLGFLDDYMERSADNHFGMPWIGGAGTFTPLHHDLTNSFLLQIVGRKRVLLAAPGETPWLYNNDHVFSAVKDLEDAMDIAKHFPLTANAAVHRIDLNPGEVLFLPVGWWHQVRALEFSVSLTQTNFRWPNDTWADYFE